MSGPLAGVRVVELAGLAPGPFACMVLADLGAHVLRVDRPVSRAGAPEVPTDALGRGRTSVAVDLKSPEGAALVRRLASDADVLVEGASSGRGQVVDAAMVDGAALLTTFLHGMRAAGAWPGARGENLLDGGAPFNDTYETADGGYMAVGALEPAFYAVLLEGLDLDVPDVPDRQDPAQWPALRSFSHRLSRLVRVPGGSRCSPASTRASPRCWSRARRRPTPMPSRARRSSTSVASRCRRRRHGSPGRRQDRPHLPPHPASEARTRCTSGVWTPTRSLRS